MALLVCVCQIAHPPPPIPAKEKFMLLPSPRRRFPSFPLSSSVGRSVGRTVGKLAPIYLSNLWRGSERQSSRGYLPSLIKFKIKTLKWGNWRHFVNKPSVALNDALYYSNKKPRLIGRDWLNLSHWAKFCLGIVTVSYRQSQI